jgi:hypothetical protein
MSAQDTGEIFRLHDVQSSHCWPPFQLQGRGMCDYGNQETELHACAWLELNQRPRLMDAALPKYPQSSLPAVEYAELVFRCHSNYWICCWPEASRLRRSSLSDRQCQVFHLLPGRLTFIGIACTIAYLEWNRYGVVEDKGAVSYGFRFTIACENVRMLACIAARTLHGCVRSYIYFAHCLSLSKPGYRRSSRSGNLLLRNGSPL